MNKVGVFVDIARQFNRNFRINYGKYLNKAVGGMDLHRAFAYGVQLDNEATDFIASLKKMGYIPRYRQARIIRHSFICQGCKTENLLEKPSILDTSWNVGITMDVMNNIQYVDKLIIGSNDPDLIPLVQWIMDQGIKVEIYSTNIPYELIEVADSHRIIDWEVME